MQSAMDAMRSTMNAKFINLYLYRQMILHHLIELNKLKEKAEKKVSFLEINTIHDDKLLPLYYKFYWYFNCQDIKLKNELSKRLLNILRYNIFVLLGMRNCYILMLMNDFMNIELINKFKVIPMACKSSEIFFDYDTSNVVVWLRACWDKTETLLKFYLESKFPQKFNFKKEEDKSLVEILNSKIPELELNSELKTILKEFCNVSKLRRELKIFRNEEIHGHGQTIVTIPTSGFVWTHDKLFDFLVKEYFELEKGILLVSNITTENSKFSKEIRNARINF